MTRTVHVRVMTRVRLILHVRRRNRDAALPLLRRIVNLVERRVSPPCFAAITFVNAAVNVVLP